MKSLLHELKRINGEIEKLTEQQCRYRREINHLIQCKPELKDYFSEKTLEESPYNVMAE